MSKNIVISPDGNYELTFIENKKTVRVYEAKTKEIKFTHLSKYKIKTVFFSPRGEYLIITNNHFVYLVNIYTEQVDFRYNTLEKNNGAYYLPNKNIVILFDKHVEILKDNIRPVTFYVEYIQPVENYNFFFLINESGLHFVNKDFVSVKKLEDVHLPFKSISYFNRKAYFLYSDRIVGPNFIFNVENVEKFFIYKKLLILLKNNEILILNKDNREKIYKALQANNFIQNENIILYFLGDLHNKINLNTISENNREDFEESEETGFLY